ncbi:DUF1552 domain-containing protein [Enhygromyxa salina]|uniref:Tat (Twin-arginine translocation) pathway signal sequence domain protein n=1 Tax=Enhygromyxa salina TaxID=215803 RepID=A0A2S9YXF9_9BACT|nr:DUF1552 domain-containing protein [Enhygromyxa salina]PRQ09783.1 hypothetical protein ENSA7_05380 [Enhygromyxa salina]
MINRRKFITASGLLAGTALFTGATLGNRAGQPQAGPANCPRRFVIFLEGNGTRPGCMYDPLTLQTLEGLAGKPIESNRDYGHDQPVLVPSAPLSDARSLGALAAGQDQISLVDRAALVLGLSGTNVGGGHSTNHGALSATKAIGGPGAATIETVLSQIPGVRGGTPFDALRLGFGDATTPLNYSSCAFGEGKPAPILMDPASVFSTLFGSVASGQAGADFQARGELLQFSLDDVQSKLGSITGSSRGRAKLETYEASLLDMIARDQQILGMQDALLAVKPPEPGELDPDPYASSAPLDRLKIQTDLTISALLAGLTNVVVVSLGSGGYYWSSQYPNLINLYPGGQMIGGHDLRHAGGAEYHEVLHELTSRYIGEMCRVARALEAQPEDGGTMLDNTLLLYMPDNGEKHHSNAEEWATLMLGGNNMGFLTDGRSVSYPRHGHANNRQISNMFNSMLHGAGQPTDDFGHANPDSRVAEGPLAELWSGA